MKRIFITSALILACALIHAQHISEEDALAYASEFFQGRATSQLPNPATGRKIARKAPRLKVAASRDEFYIFNDEANDGFVIVSAEAATPTILGYSYEGSYDETDVPEAMQAWLDSYAEQIRWVASNQLTETGVSFIEREKIAPLLKSKWHQDAPYNGACPKYNGEQCPTGCGPNAMAQVMNYWKYPETVQKTIARTLNANYSDYQSEVPAGTPIEWSKILNNYEGTTTLAQQQAVANLLFYCGLSSSTAYFPNGTTSDNTTYPHVLREYFGYQGAMRVWNRQNMSYERWQEIIYDELSHGRPVIMGGCTYYVFEDGEAGHVFVCDGYDGEDFYHINWGWGGEQDAFFRLDILNFSSLPGNRQDIRLTYCYNTDIVTGIQPQASSEPATSMVYYARCRNIANSAQAAFERASSDNDFANVQLVVHFIKSVIEGDETCFDVAIGLYRGDEKIKDLQVMEDIALNLTTGYTFKSTFGAGLPLGDYVIHPLWRLHGEKVWRRVETEQSLMASISETTLVLKKPTPQVKLVSMDSEIKFGVYQEMLMTFENEGDLAYQGELTISLNANHFDTKKPILARMYLSLAPGEQQTRIVPMVCDTTGIVTVTVKDENNNQIGTSKIRVTSLQISAKANQDEYGSVTISGNGRYYSGESVKVTATANEGYEFLNWTEEIGQQSQVVSNSATYTFSAWANTTMVANFAPREEPITVTADSYSVTYGDEIPLLTYTVTGNGTLDGAPQLFCDAYKGCAAGTYTVRIERGTVTNRKVTFKSGKITVAKAPLTIGVEDATITLGNPLPTFRLTYDGFVNGDTEKIAFSTLPRARVNGGTPTEAGTYPIIVSGGVSDRYALTRVNGTLTVLAPDAIRSLLDSGTPFDVYNLLGKRLRTGARSFKGLPSGIYIVNGQKVVVR
ncbi:MAG: C10 family peptidase [Bacteroidaceae bacterium]|nr:C10 family peptidase [Bacteroidaceae bacterium]